MFEPTTVPIEMLSLTVIANQSRFSGATPALTLRDLQHYPIGVSLIYPFASVTLLSAPSAVPLSNCYVVTFISMNQIFLGDAQAVGGIVPAGSVAPTLQLGYLVQGSSGEFQPISGPLQWQTLANAPFIAVIPPNSFPTIQINFTGGVPSTNRADFRWNGYLLPAGKQPIFQQLSTIFSTS